MMNERVMVNEREDEQRSRRSYTVKWKMTLGANRIWVRPIFLQDRKGDI